MRHCCVSIFRYSSKSHPRVAVIIKFKLVVVTEGNFILSGPVTYLGPLKSHVFFVAYILVSAYALHRRKMLRFFSLCVSPLHVDPLMVT